MKSKLVKVSLASYAGLVVLALVMTVTNSFADESTPGFDLLGIKSAIDKFHDSFNEYADKIINPSTNYSNYLKEQVGLSQINKSIELPVKETSNQAANDLLANSILFVPNSMIATKKYAKFMPKSSEEAVKSSPFFNSSDYLNTYVVNTSSTNIANFIGALASVGNPIQALPPTAYKNLDANPAAATFLAGLTSYSARTSVGIGALSQLIYERTPVKGLKIDGQPASLLSYDAALATQRMNEKWFTGVLTNSKTTPADLMREQLLVSAESRYELFEVRLQLEQLNATLAALQLGYEEGTNKPLLLSARNEAISATLEQ